MKFYNFALLALALVSLATISKAQIGDIIDDIGNEIGDTAEDVVDTITDGGDDVGDNVSEGVDDIGDNISEGVDDIGENISEGIDDIGEDISNGVDDAIIGIIAGAALPDGAGDIWKEINGLLDQAREQGYNASTPKIVIMDLFNGANMDELCNSCVEFVDDIKDKSDESEGDNSGEDILIDLFFTVCDEFFGSQFCTDATRDLISSMYESLTDPAVNSTWACQRLAMCPYLVNNDTLNPFVDDVLQNKPENDVPAAANRSTYQVLHMTDIHLDFSYQEGTWARCGGFQCCRADSGDSPNPDDPFETAGYWGGLGVCDLPPRTYEQFLRFASNNFNFSFILWTGDNIDHVVWAQSQDTQLNPTQNATSYLQDFFPNTTIYPMFGNHENFFSDQFDTTGDSDDWLKTELGNIWQSLFNEATLNEFTTNTYYSTVNEDHNLKVISLDTQTCDTLNFHLIEDSNVDPLNQLNWLRDELLDAENNNQTVFIMGHISPGDLNCDPQWSARYRAIVDRYTNIIRGQFFGHTHKDQFQVVRSYGEDSSPVGVIFLAPSLSTYTELNPSFRVYEIDSETNQIVDYKQYRLNLTKWNENTTGPIEWDLAYSFLEEYGLNDTSYQSLDSLADRIRDDNSTAETYISNFHTGVGEVNTTERSIDYYYCFAKYSQAHQIVDCLGLDPAKTNLLYFASEFAPGVIDDSGNNNNNE